MCDRESGFNWQAFLAQHVPVTQTMDLEHDESVILEVLKVAYAGLHLDLYCLSLTHLSDRCFA